MMLVPGFHVYDHELSVPDRGFGNLDAVGIDARPVQHENHAKLLPVQVPENSSLPPITRVSVLSVIVTVGLLDYH